MDSKYKYSDERGVFRLDNLTGAGLRNGDSGKPWRGFDPSGLGRHWAAPRQVVESILGPEKTAKMTTQEKLDYLLEQGYIQLPQEEKGGRKGFPQLKRFLGAGVPLQDVITDISPINSQAQERLGYPTQKPESLLERFILASSNEGDTILDPFCGCGTAIAAAHRLNRRWAGIDVTHLAITLIKHRLRDSFPGNVPYKTVGEPVSLPDAQALADSDRYQFQWWALGLVGARPVEQKKGADKGIDGRLYFHDEGGSKTKQVVLSVKSGNLKATDVRDLRGVLDREQAQIGVLLTMGQPTKPMRAEVASAGFYESPWSNRKHPRLQILTVGDILDGRHIDMPPIRQTSVTFKKAPKAKGAKATQGMLEFQG